MTDHENMGPVVLPAAQAAAAKRGGSAMDIAVVGPNAPSLCAAAGLGALAFFTLSDATERAWDLLALVRPAVGAPFPQGLRARSLLLPGDSDASFALLLRAPQVVTYGLSPRDTLTLSSLAGAERLLCLQRSLLTLGGTLLEPQEFPLSSALNALPDEHALLVAGLRLLAS